MYVVACLGAGHIHTTQVIKMKEPHSCGVDHVLLPGMPSEHMHELTHVLRNTPNRCLNCGTSVA